MDIQKKVLLSLPWLYWLAKDVYGWELASATVVVHYSSSECTVACDMHSACRGSRRACAGSRRWSRASSRTRLRWRRAPGPSRTRRCSCTSRRSAPPFLLNSALTPQWVCVCCFVLSALSIALLCRLTAWSGGRASCPRSPRSTRAKWSPRTRRCEIQRIFNNQGHSQDFFFGGGGGGAQTKFPVRSQKILVRSGDIQKNLLNKDFKKFWKFILKSHKNL